VQGDGGVVTGSFVERGATPTIAPSTSAGIFGHEAVVFCFPTTTVHRLDPIGSLIWQCLDGATTVDELTLDLADAFATDRAAVAADVVGLLEKLIDAGAVVLSDGGPSPSITPDDAPRVLTNPPSP
jgi:hypothetical protein